ncbi:MAG: MmgE/PrpD family protein [Thermodesulfobacteriota bacterium]|nr:MmgE/PrpD family protein [Thermodesulfobacteriota bacterium]
MKKDACPDSAIIGELSAYISRGGEAELPSEVVQKAKHHILDTLAAMVSGSKLKPGQLARKYVESQEGVEEAQVAGSPIVTSAINAAFANGVMVHADETDDSHERSRTHPGCAIVPAALSVSERTGADGISFLKGVVVGYDIGCRMPLALGVDHLRNGHRSTHAIGGNFGAAASAAAVLRLKENLVRYVLSYTGQQVSGVMYWARDEEHIEKAFVFGGMPARNGVTAAILIQAGFTGVYDPFSGEHNFFEAFSPYPSPERLIEGLGSHYEIMSTSIKKYSVGSPIQPALDALLLLIEKHGLRGEDVQTIIARLPEDGVQIVDNRDMPSINLQHLLAMTLLDGDITFEATHSFERMKDPSVLEIRKRITLLGDRSMARIKRQGVIEVTKKDGTQLKEHVISVRGTPENPMTTEEVEKKCSELLIPVLGKGRTQKLIDTIWNLEQMKNVRELRPLFSVSSTA